MLIFLRVVMADVACLLSVEIPLYMKKLGFRVR